MSKEDNRRKMPETAKLIDQFREVFGNDCKIIRAIEDGPEGRIIVGKWTEEEAAQPLQPRPNPSR